MFIPEHIQETFKHSKCLHTLGEIDLALDRMAAQITEKLHDERPVVLCVMIGGLIPTGHLVTRLNFPLEIDYIRATRYKGEMHGGEVEWINRPNTDLNGRTVLIIEDILDGGLTLAEIIKYCYDHGAAKVFTAVLVDKKRTRESGGVEKADFVGLEVEDKFIYGFGMDYQEYLRNAPGIFIVEE